MYAACACCNRPPSRRPPAAHDRYRIAAPHSAVPSSLPVRFATGCPGSACTRSTSSRGAHGRTVTMKASMENFATSCSTARSSTRSGSRHRAVAKPLQQDPAAQRTPLRATSAGSRQSGRSGLRSWMAPAGSAFHRERSNDCIRGGCAIGVRSVNLVLKFDRRVRSCKLDGQVPDPMIQLKDRPILNQRS